MTDAQKQREAVVNLAIGIIEEAGVPITDAAIIELLAAMVLAASRGVTSGFLRLSPDRPIALDLDDKPHL